VAAARLYGRVWIPAYASARLHECGIVAIGCLHIRTSLSPCMQKQPASLAHRKREWISFLRSQVHHMQRISQLMIVLASD
jgi:hypothetical protein